MSLATLESASLVLPEITSSLGIRDVQGEDTVERIAERVGSLPALLILDNMEHVISIAPEIAKLLQYAPSLRAISTTREPLMVRGEIAYPVHPLKTEADSPGDISAAEQLFINRAMALRSLHSLGRSSGRFVSGWGVFHLRSNWQPPG
ncbi:hypothetical protein BH23CHL5_BH23CHL5_04540 [soil metagenome]